MTRNGNGSISLPHGSLCVVPIKAAVGSQLCCTSAAASSPYGNTCSRQWPFDLPDYYIMMPGWHLLRHVCVCVYVHVPRRGELNLEIFYFLVLLVQGVYFRDSIARYNFWKIYKLTLRILKYLCFLCSSDFSESQKYSFNCERLAYSYQWLIKYFEMRKVR